MINVLFVCLGNICRSPMAEAILRYKVSQLGLGSAISADSAGTANYHVGDDPDHRTIEVAARHQVPVNHKGRQFHYLDGQRFHYILAMDTANHRDIIHELGDRHEGLFLMRHFDSASKGGNVPDPYYGTIDDFEEVFDILDRSIDNFIAHVRETHQL